MIPGRLSPSLGRMRVWIVLCGTLVVLLLATIATTRTADAQSPSGTVPTLPEITLTPFLSGFDQPIALTHAGDGSARIFVVERAGVVRVWQDGQVRVAPFLNISDKVISTCGECGLLGLAFAPDYVTSGEFYVYYTANANVAPPSELGQPESGNDTVVARYHVSSDPNIADAESEEIILALNQPFRNHNGGQINFGPDGFLYIGLGDGGSGGDPLNYAQRLNQLLGKMLRLDVSGVPTYTIPADNPFVDAATVADPDGAPVTPRPEIWSYGWRNPWRWSFDRETGDMLIADVGQGSWEEVNFAPAASAGGENYGWRIMEGSHCFAPATGCDPSGLVLPIFEYENTGGAAIIGGYVYRGLQTPLVGTYLVGDFSSGIIWGLMQDGATWLNEELLNTDYNISAFGEDEYGELYVVDYAGDIYRVVVPSFAYPFELQAPLILTAESAN